MHPPAGHITPRDGRARRIHGVARGGRAGHWGRMSEHPDRARTVFKIVDGALWREAEASGAFEGAGIDLSDGFIHFSTAAQARETAARHYAGRDGLLLVAIDGGALDAAAGEAFRYEPSRGGDLFPHLYGPLPMDCVLWARPLPLGPDGHQFPDGV